VVATADATDTIPALISATSPVSTASIVGEDVQRPAAMMLFIVGLSGLAAAGSRPARRTDRLES
jgi:hypothetical protein